MRKTILSAFAGAALALAAVPALAGSNWEGEFFNAGPFGDSGTFDANLSKGKITGDITSLFTGSTFEPAALAFTGRYTVDDNGRMKGNLGFVGKFTGWRGQGQMSATFKNGGGFNATKTGKDSGGGKRGK